MVKRRAKSRKAECNLCGLMLLLCAAAVFGATYENPVISGFHPDPSICRAGSDYYLVTSTFEYFPGVPIFHSKDLVNWRRIGYCLTRNSQLPLKECNASSGIYAPTIRYNDGIFYLVVTNYADKGNGLFTATNPAGPWSEPIWLNDWTCDPSLFFDDDGKIYYTAGDCKRITQCLYNPVTKKLEGPLREIWQGHFQHCPEGPHLYKINCWYYLMAAEGGTGYTHMETIARSKSPWGPFTSYSGNPILTHRYRPEHPVQACGHADLVETPAGWWMVFLGIRPKGGKFSHLGRETFLAPVEWNSDGWPIVNQNGRVELRMQAPSLPSCVWPQDPARDEFRGPEMGMLWNYLRNPVQSDYSLTARPGYLRLMGSAVTLNETKSPTFAGQRQTLFECTVRTRLEFNPSANEEAGLTVFGNNKNHFDIGVTVAEDRRRIFLRKTLNGAIAEFLSSPIGDGPVELTVAASDLNYTFYYQVDGEPVRVIATAQTKLLAPEIIGGFTGTYFGLYATGNGTACASGAYFDWFEVIRGSIKTLPSPSPDELQGYQQLYIQQSAAPWE